MVASVRAKRAVAALTTMSPKTGAFSANLSSNSENALERFFAWTKTHTVAPMPANTTYHHACISSDAVTIILVNAGRSPPIPWNSDSNCGTTNTSRIAVTMNATTSTATG